MRKDLQLFKNFWKETPSIFDIDFSWPFKNLSTEFDKILNGRSDFEELDDKYIIEIEVPGVKKDEINISLKDDVITVSWKREREKKEGIKNIRYERSMGSFTRSFSVEGADANNIKAELKNGVLKIVVPKLEHAKAKQIEIKD